MAEHEKRETLEHDSAPRARFSRRGFLTTSSVALASSGVATIGGALLREASAAPPAQATPEAAATPLANGTMPGMDQEERPAEFFNIHEASTVDALVSRILPGDADDPGAHEAGVVFYIDRALGGANLGYTLKTYTQGPFPITSEAPVPVESSSARYGYDAVPISPEQISRYGYQSVLSPQELYRRGLESVDAYAQSQHQKNFVDLSAEQQDQILTDMNEDKATGFEGPNGKAFFTQLRNDTIEGMFGDPMHGGNRDMVGWKLIGYPGAQRLYTPDEIKNAGFTRAPQSLGQLIAKEGH